MLSHVRETLYILMRDGLEFLVYKKEVLRGGMVETLVGSLYLVGVEELLLTGKEDARTRGTLAGCLLLGSSVLALTVRVFSLGCLAWSKASVVVLAPLLFFHSLRPLTTFTMVLKDFIVTVLFLGSFVLARLFLLQSRRPMTKLTTVPRCVIFNVTVAIFCCI